MGIIGNKIIHLFIPLRTLIRCLWFSFGVLLLVFTADLRSHASPVGVLDSLKKELAQVQNDTEFVLTAMKISRQTHREAPEKEEAIEYAQMAVEKANLIGNKLLYAKALDNLGLIHRFHHAYERAVDLHIQAFNLIKEDKNQAKSKMRFANNTGVAARYCQQYDVAVAYYLKAYKIAIRENDPRNILISCNGLGNALAAISGREQEALQYFNQALYTAVQQKDSLSMAMNLLSLCEYFIQEKEESKAFQHLEKLYTINKKRNDSFGLAITSESYARAYQKLSGNNEKAAQHFKKALKIYQHSKNSLKEAEVLNEIGALYLSTGALSTSQEYFTKALRIAEEIDNTAIAMESLYGLSEIKEGQGKYQEALHFYKKGKDYEGSLQLHQQKVKITALKSQFDLEKKEQQISLLENEKILRQEELAGKKREVKLLRIYAVTILVVIALGVLLLIIQMKNRKAKRLYEKKLQENEQKLLEAQYEKNLAQAEIQISRMQINPHFLFNCLNAIKLLIQKQENKKAERYLTTFSRFNRIILELSRKDTISLKEELELIVYYLKLESTRFDNEFHFDVDTLLSEQELSTVKIPPMLLQPFVENAIWHGLLPSIKPTKHLKISIIKIENKLKITIEDNGVGRRKVVQESQSSEKSTHKKMGMQITKERIHQFNQSYDCKIDLEIIDKEERQGTIVLLTITFPQND